jgi:hypothetical protein
MSAIVCGIVDIKEEEEAEGEEESRKIFSWSGQVDGGLHPALANGQ